MAVPKKRHTKSRRNRGRMHIYLKSAALILCPKCGKSVRPHTVCLSCGYYKGKQVIDVLEKLSKKQRKEKEKEIVEAEKKPKGRPLSLRELSKK